MTPEQSNKNPQIRKRKEDPPFRRKEDQLRFDLIERIVGAIKWLIALVAIILYMFYSTINSQNRTDSYQLKILNDLNEKLVNLQKTINTDRNPNPDRNPQPLPGQCNVCHHLRENSIIIRTNWEYEDFRKYVRGELRIPENKIMPKFNRNQISDDEIRTIFEELKK